MEKNDNDIENSGELVTKKSWTKPEMRELKVADTATTTVGTVADGTTSNPS